MESVTVPLPGSYSYTIFDPLQSVQFESNPTRHYQHPDTITLSQDDFNCVLEWAYPDVAYQGSALPMSGREAFPAHILSEIQQTFGNAGYASYEVRYSEEKNEYFLIGLKGSERHHLAQWRQDAEVRSVRELIDDAAPSMRQFMMRHKQIGRLVIFLGAAAGALEFTNWRLDSISPNSSNILHYSAVVFFCLAGAALVWFGLNYGKSQSAEVVFEIEEIDKEVIGVSYM